METKTTKTGAAPIVTKEAATSATLYRVKVAGDLKFAPYKAESKLFGKSHYTFGRGASYVDFIPGGAKLIAQGSDKDTLITDAKGLAAIQSYAKAKGYSEPQSQEVK